MPSNYQVEEGDCIDSIAFQYGFKPETLWNDPANADLKRTRVNPNVLAAGDVVVIPDLRQVSKDLPSQKRHRFRRLGVPARLVLRILNGGEPAKSAPYLLDIDGTLSNGTTTADGTVSIVIPPDAKHGNLKVKTATGTVEYNLTLGQLDPISTIRGVQQRLRNLGISCPDSSEIDDDTQAAIRTFQAKSGLPETGEVDDATRQALQSGHDLE